MACRCVGCIYMMWEWIESRKYQQENINKKNTIKKNTIKKISWSKIKTRKWQENRDFRFAFIMYTKFLPSEFIYCIYIYIFTMIMACGSMI